MWYGKGFNDGDGEPPRPKKQEQEEVRLTARYLNKDNDESSIGPDDDYNIFNSEEDKISESISFEKLYQEIDKKESELHDMDAEGHIWWHRFRNFLKDLQNGK